MQYAHRLWLCLLFLAPTLLHAPTGVQAQTGERTEYLMVGYAPKGRIPGVVVYRNDGGTLRGKWTNGQARGRILTETAVPESLTNGIEGTYETTGVNPDGRTYRGKLGVRKIGDKVYTLAWTNGDTGIGILAGQVLVVGYGEQAGVMIYALRKDGGGDGGWTTVAAAGGIGREQFFGGGGLTATHRTKGTLPNGAPYEGMVTITKEGNTYRLVWSTGEVGIGLLTTAK
ncbi:MAG: hypothetical protein NZ585_13825 [Chloracidobacterium sp.]|nr:hypothetical protein [Chloracidobacterium sp.]MDW8217925.1 hypothetical protein [Acidobacteriota bacterium]